MPASSSPAAPLTAPPGWLEVWLEAGREGRTFTYANPEALGIGVGDLVRVRLQGRPHTGLVVATAMACPAAMEGRPLLPVEAVLQSAAIDPHWQALLEQVARQCHAGLFRTLKSALPPGWLGQAHRAPTGQGRILWTVRLNPDTSALASHPRQQELLDHLASHGGARLLRDLVQEAGFGRSLIGTMERRGLLLKESGRSPGRVGGGGGDGPTRLEPPQRASPAQAEAMAAIADAPPGQALLLWGVTGSGKTEVYLQAAAWELAAGRSVLILAPEIGLIPQLLDRCRRRFGAAVIEYHSGMGDAERVVAWRRCLEASGHREACLAVGTRSAVFLPLGHLGLIVLDEEHDASYKQESPMPCYHAREVARLRASQTGARLVLGSATPSLETWWRCQSGPQGRPGDTRLLPLPERIGQRPLPPVRLVDMRQELVDGHRRLISRPLMARLERLKETGEQAVVLVPRRGYRSFLSCRSCGEVVLCPHCDVALTVHRGPRAGGQEGREWLRCHWCDHRQEMGDRCGHCGSTAFKPFGAGTQRVMEQLATELEGLRLIRFDRDTTRGRDGHRRLLERFAAGEADVLVGTQMLAKGMDLPAVTLAAVLAADGLLHRPDLRAAEQSLQLLLQLAGRAGRGERPGEVLVQTYSPDHPVIRHLVDGRYGAFLAEELELRRQGGMVPFGRACLLRLAGPTASGTATAAAALAERIRPAVERAGWVLIGPAPAPVARVAGRSRWQLLLHGPGTAALPLPPDAELRRALPPGVSLTIDPDPLEL
ncbi:primosomal protein N' [Cyanobium sp. Cruz CV13-4-11]|uniref:replication restart helicase PriA n=1 Tax=unclassified Cyanobium TaxID=2627006 RepID=UPI0020CB8443|nr:MULTISPECIES: primosomal protein N' [unclassified Cyanobium]MCP9899940.1 primosomal protein N' [Cyanobium sp. Cruz CV11-17]MCP9918971.1 primosomal protein N' [Cyanobium sp. Cruz CV13-4-11]